MKERSDYKPDEFEVSRQQLWEKDKLHRVVEDPDKQKYFIVDMFPYPSGSGIHVGHVKNYVATDVQARVLTRQGLNVLHPMGYDSFGLPAENYAISKGIHPKVAVQQNIDRFGNQLRRLGLGYDWERQINTTDDEFIKWTQDCFLTLYEMGLATEEEKPINWCDSCKTGLSNEDLEEDNTCERCGTPVQKKMMRQWSVHITEYADELLDGMKELTEWEPFLLDIQRNWIGRQEGWQVSTTIKTDQRDLALEVFTKDPAVLVDAKFVAISPETANDIGLPDLLREHTAIKDYIEKNLYKRDKDRKEAEGVLLPFTVTNPYNGQVLPLYVSEAILPTADNGAIFGNPKLKERDARLAAGLGLKINVADGSDVSLSEEEVKQLAEKGIINPKKIYRLEDWVFSRQRFWGEPIPMVHCGDCGTVPVPRDQLPVLLPDVESYELTETGESPLANIPEWVNTTCPKCGGDAKRETNTMPQWAGSSWYWHRYKDPHNALQLVSPEADSYWRQVDMYVGGAEHAARHLIYGRFWNFVLKQAGVVVDKEPFKKVQHVGLVMDEHGVKISKRLGNSVDIDEVIREYGADALRLGAMQMGEFASTTNWNNREIQSARKFLIKVWRMQDKVDWANAEKPSVDDYTLMNETIDKVTSDIRAFKFNTSIASIRTFAARLGKKSQVTFEEYTTLLSLLQPFTPHTTEQILSDNLENPGYMMKTPWPSRVDIRTETSEREVVITKNGKKIDVVSIDSSVTDPQELIEHVREQSEKAARIFAEEAVKRVISPPGKDIVNIVT